MHPLRAVGTAVAVVVGVGAGVGAALSVESPFAVGAAAALASLVVGYAAGHRGWVAFATALSFAGTGTAVLAGTSGVGPPALTSLELSMIPLQVGGAFVGVGGAVAVLFLLRWSTGNLKRLSTRPVDAGAVRGAVASVAGTLKGGRSLVRRLAGVRLGPLPVGAVAVFALWGGVVAGSAALGVSLSQGALGVDQAVSLPFATDRPVSALLAPVTLVPYLAGLLVPAYLVTDWFALDGIEDAPETYGVLARATGRSPRPAGPAATGSEDIDASSTADPGDPAPGNSSPETPAADPTPDATVTAAGTRDTPSAAPDPDADSAGGRVADTDGGTRPEATAEVPDPTDGDGDAEHWPNAEDNPWVGADRSTRDSPTRDTPEDTDDEETPALTPDVTGEIDGTDETGEVDEAGETGEVDELTDDEPDDAGLADDGRVTFGEPSADDHRDAPTTGDADDTPDVTAVPPEPSDSPDADSDGPTTDSTAETDDDTDGTTAVGTDDDIDGTTAGMSQSDEATTATTDPRTWETPPGPAETDDETAETDHDTTAGLDSDQDDAADGPDTEHLDVELPDVDVVRRRFSRDGDDDAGAEDPDSDASDENAPSSGTGVDTTDPNAGSDTAESDSEHRAEQVADRVSRILDGDLDAGEVDPDDIDLPADSTVDPDAVTDASEPDDVEPASTPADPDPDVDTTVADGDDSD